MLDLYRFTHFQKEHKLLHAVTTKSTHFPHGFSLALHTGENPKSIVENREYLSRIFNPNKKLHYVLANQTHSDNIKIIQEKETKGWRELEDAIPDCDALITNVPDVILSVLTADCVPILLYDKKQQVVAAVHAGWKGSKAQILKKTVEKMIQTFDTKASDIKAGIAPSIGSCCYEVGKEVAEHFLNIPHACKKKEEKYMLDLPLVNKKQLLDIGIKEKNIEMSHICTACDVEHYFSYRKEQGCSGRFMSMIGLLSEGVF